MPWSLKLCPDPSRGYSAPVLRSFYSVCLDPSILLEFRTRRPSYRPCPADSMQQSVDWRHLVAYSESAQIVQQATTPTRPSFVE